MGGVTLAIAPVSGGPRVLTWGDSRPIEDAQLTPDGKLFVQGELFEADEPLPCHEIPFEIVTWEKWRAQGETDICLGAERVTVARGPQAAPVDNSTASTTPTVEVEAPRAM